MSDFDFNKYISDPTYTHGRYYITHNGLLRCDGLIFDFETFKECDNKKVPIVNDYETDNVIGIALLKNAEDGVYVYCSFFDKNYVLDENKYGIGFSANDVVFEPHNNYKRVVFGTITGLHITPINEMYIYHEVEVDESR